MDPRSGYLLERLPKTEVEDLALEEVPEIGYRDVGGLGPGDPAARPARREDQDRRVETGDFFRKYLTSDLPIAAADARQHGGVPTAIEAMIESALEAMYSRDEDNQFLDGLRITVCLVNVAIVWYLARGLRRPR